MDQENKNNEIKKETTWGPIVVSRVFKNEHQKEGTLTAELKQEVTTVSYYPSKRIDNEMEDNLFTSDAFGFVDNDYPHVEIRVAWTLVPTDATVESVQTMVDAAKASRCYKVMGNRPTLTSGQKHAIATGLRTLPEIAMKQITKYGKDHSKAGQVIKLNDRVQYRKIYFSTGVKDEEGNLVPKTDIDRRGKEDEYIPEVLAAELTSFTEEQTVE